MRRNPDKVTKIVTALNLKILPRDLKSKDGRHLLSVIFSQWLSLSTCIIQAVVDVVPPPSVAQRTRIPKMLYPDLYEPTLEPKNKLEENLYACNSSSDASIIALVSKMFAVPSKDLPANKKKPMTADEMRSRARAAREAREAAESEGKASGPVSTPLDEALDKLEVKAETDVPKEEDETLVGFARIYSGTIRTGTTIFCVLPKYDNSLEPTHPRNVAHVVATQVEALYVMMGRELVVVDSVEAGNVFAIQGLEGKVWRNATLCAPSADGIQETLDSTQSSDYLLNLGGAVNAVRRIS